MLRSWFRRAKTTRPRPGRSTCRLELEALEDRRLLALQTWTGMSTGSDFWTDPNNWQSLTTPSPGDALAFPQGALRTTNTNNFPADTTFNAVSIDAGYTLTGNPIQITGGMTASGSSTLALGLSLPVDQTFNVATGAVLTLNGAVGGDGGVILQGGNGTLELNTANTYLGPTIVSNGVLTIRNSLALGSGPNGTLVNGGTLKLEGNINVPAEPLTLDNFSFPGAGHLENLTGLNSWGGPITLQGTQLPGNNVIVIAVDAGQLTLSGAISGPAALGLSKVGPGVLALSGANTYAGNTLVNGGTLALGASNVLPDTTTVQVASGATLSLATFQDTVAGFQLINGLVSGTAPLTSTSDFVLTTGTVAATLAGNVGASVGTGGNVVLDAPAAYTGITTVAGTLNAAAPDVLASSSGLAVVAGGVFDLRGNSQLIAGPLTGSGTVTNSTGPGIATLTLSGSVNSTFAGVLSGNLGLTKAGVATLTLTGTNTYVGPTTINGGRLIVNGSQAASPVTINSGGILSGTGTVGAITGASGGSVAPGTTPGILNATGIAFQPGFTYVAELDGATAGTFDQINVTGPVSLGGSTLQALANFAAPVGTTLPIIVNDGTDPVSGTFNGLAEGATFTPGGSVPGQLFRITYVGGDGNDVVLIRANSAPVITQLTVTPSSIDEGGTVTLNGTFTDQDTSDTHTVTVTWGDNTTDTVNLPAGQTTFSLQHQYFDGGVLTITATVTDPNGGSGSATTTVTVRNVAPTLTLSVNPATIAEGQSTTLTGTITDPGTRDSHNVVIVWGDGTPNTNLTLAAGVLTFSEVHTYQDQGTFTITVTVTDKDGGSVTGTAQVMVTNLRPVVTPPANQSAVVNVAQDFQLGSFTDVPTDGPWTVTVNWGDATSPTIFQATQPGTLGQRPHTYVAADTYTVTVTVADKDAQAGSATFLVTVTQVRTATATTLVSSAPVSQVGQPVTFTATVTAQGRAGTPTGTVTFRDGQQTLGQVPLVNGVAALTTAALAAGTHTIVAVYTGDAAFLPSSSPPLTQVVQATVPCEPLPAFLQQLYLDILERPADPQGLAFWTQRLQEGMTRSQVAAFFWESPEHRRLQVTEFYNTMLNRAPEPAGLEAWVSALLSGVSESDVVTYFLTSLEYTLLHPTNQDYVTGLYQDLFNISVSAGTLDPIFVAFWQSQLDSGAANRAGLAFLFLSSDAAYQTAISESYGFYLDRTPSEQERLAWVARILSGSETPTGFAVAFLGSEEYFLLAQQKCRAGTSV